jgi:hypothetical protein
MMSHATRERPVDYISKVWSIIFWGFAWFHPPLISECILEAPFSLLRLIYRFTAIDTNNNEGHLA